MRLKGLVTGLAVVSVAVVAAGYAILSNMDFEQLREFPGHGRNLLAVGFNHYVRDFPVQGVTALHQARQHGFGVILVEQRPIPGLGRAAQLLGATDRLITLASEYAEQRQQFGKPIGSFQAVKHMLANCKVKLEYARPVVHRAAHSVARAVTDRGLHASMAKVAGSGLLRAFVKYQCNASGHSLAKLKRCWLRLERADGGRGGNVELPWVRGACMLDISHGAFP